MFMPRRARCGVRLATSIDRRANSIEVATDTRDTSRTAESTIGRCFLTEIAVASYFRNSQTWHGRRIDQAHTYFANVEREAKSAGVTPRYYLLEGDSSDDTWETLCRYHDERPDQIHLTKYSVRDAPPIASIVSNDRFRTLSEVGNVVLRGARDSGADLVFWIESDLLPQENLLSGLMDATRILDWERVLAVAPVAVIAPGGHRLHYDVWAFEGSHGERFNNDDLGKLLASPFGRYWPMNAVGSCALLNGRALREAKIDFGDGCFPALCRAARDAGLNVLCDLAVRIEHPSNFNVAGRWI